MQQYLNKATTGQCQLRVCFLKRTGPRLFSLGISKEHYNLTSVRGLQSIFDSHCIEGPPEQRCEIALHSQLSRWFLTNIHPDWTKESLQTYLQETQPDSFPSEDAVQLLWKCFHFYAYHRFPRSASNDDKLDFEAFQRSVTLLAVNDTELLGTPDEGDCCWRPDDGSLHKACFRRILRDIDSVERSFIS